MLIRVTSQTNPKETFEVNPDAIDCVEKTSNSIVYPNGSTVVTLRSGKMLCIAESPSAIGGLMATAFAARKKL